MNNDIKFSNHRNEIERQIIVLLVEDILAAGYAIQVNDGEKNVLRPSRNADTIFAAMSTTDKERLFLYKRGEKNEATGKTKAVCVGWIYLVYGNDGWDVVSDYTCNLKDNTPEIFKRANGLSDRFSGG